MRTASSIQALKLCSNCAHPAAAFAPDEAQHPIDRSYPSANCPFLSPLNILVLFCFSSLSILPYLG